MKGQGNILKTLLIVAVVYTLALGAPVKRDTSNSTVTSNTVISNTVTEAASAAATDIKNIKNCSDTDILVITPNTYSEDDAAEYLSVNLTTKNFSGAVCEAVWKCLNHSNFEQKKCKVAAAAMELHDTINKFIVKHGTTPYAQPLPIDCCTSTDEVEVEGPLCYASVYTQKILAGIDGRQTPICF